MASADSTGPSTETRTKEEVLKGIVTYGDTAPADPRCKAFTYGTAGFRTIGSYLAPAMARLVPLAVLRSQRFSGAAIGIMITASHNPAQDNGFKIVDPNGEMLEQSWEAHATQFANCKDMTELVDVYTKLAESLNVDIMSPAKIVYAADTRQTSVMLMEILRQMLNQYGKNVTHVDLGVTTTPVLHYVVKASNDKTGAYGTPTIEGYFDKMATAFETLMANKPADDGRPPLYVDCANGVGAGAVETLQKRVAKHLTIKPLCTDMANPDVLNFECGADFVKTKQMLPPAVKAAKVLETPDNRGCSIDGDADRVVYYYLRDGKTFRLLDGDKIAVLGALFIEDLVKRANLHDDIKVGVVQTAYANGSSTKFIKQRNIPVTCTPTGVKHLHHAALKYDIGVYFEANGHGTVLFSPSTLEKLATTEPSSPDEKRAIAYLIALSNLINQAVGDALSDFLMVEVILAHRGYGAAEWDAAYEDLPNRLVKVEVPDRTIFKTTDAERKLTSPPGLQQQIDEAVAKVDQGRSFVRPSGTEDCVRVYAEAATTAATESLAGIVTDLVKQAAASHK